MSKKGFYEDKSSRFDRLVARYYLMVCNFAARLTDDPRDAVALTRQAFNGARKQLQRMRSQTAIATILIAAVLRTGLASA
jgi:DNA-directed RNA polymerase specialized sigma24 family protein